MSLIDHTTDRLHGEAIRPSHVPSEHIIERRDLGRSARGIHPALSFLSAYGVAPNIIIQAAAEAAATGIRPEQALLASGLLTEESYYRALARHLGLRLARFGFDTGALDASTYEEAPADLRRWMNQRRRWFKGWIQTLLVHGAHPMDSVRRVGVAHTAAALLIVVGTLTGALLGPFFAALALWDAFHGDFLAPATPTQLVISTLWCFVGLSGLASAFWPVLLGMKRRSLWRYWHLLLVSPVYWTLMTVASWWAVLDFMRNPFNRLKTKHGLARNRRLPLPG